MHLSTVKVGYKGDAVYAALAELRTRGVYEQHLQNTRQNALPMKLIDRSLLMRHKHLACTLVQQMEIGETPASSDGILHHPPEAFNGVEMVPTMGR